MNLLSKLPMALLAFSTTKDRSKELKRLASSMDVEIPVLKVLLKKQRAKMKNDEGNNKKAQYIDWVLAKETGKETKSARKLSAGTIISTSSKGAANQRKKKINSKAKPTTLTATLTATATATDEEKRKQKKETLSKLKSMATKQREKMNKKQVQMSDRPPVTIKQQVASAVQSQKASAKASASACTNNRDHDGGKSFMELGVPSNLVKGLTEMGIVDPTPIQKKAIPHAIKGKDVMGLAQTGTGKTLAFGLPLVSQMLEEIKISTINYKGDRNAMRVSGKKKPIRGLVLAPTRELANQIAVSLGTLTQNTPIQSFVVVGGQNIKTQINKLRGGTDLLVATPGRLIDLMDRGALSLSGTTFLVLDEADLMLDMGFMPSLRKIEKMLPKKRQTMLFSATMAKDMNVVARSFLKDPVRVEVAKAGRTADKIVQELHFIPKADKTAKLLELLSDPDNRNDRSIVFGRTKHGMEKLSKKLIAAGIEAGSIHGNKSQPQRDRAIAAFKAGEIKVLVATDVAARGLDIPDVKRVFNFELPNVPEAYVHRIGRTARAGKEGAAVAFCSVEEMDDLMDIQKVTGLKIPVVSGTPWDRGDTKKEKERIKKNKIENQRIQRENRNRKRNKQQQQQQR